MYFKNNRSNKPTYTKPHISIDNRGRVHFNAAYLRAVTTRHFSIHETPEGIVMDHDGQDFTIKLQHKAKYTACKGLGEYLKEKAGESIFPQPDLVGGMLIPFAESKELKTALINGTLYNITGAKNYLNTIRKRSQESAKPKTNAANIYKFNTVLQIAKATWPEGFQEWNPIS